MAREASSPRRVAVPAVLALLLGACSSGVPTDTTDEDRATTVGAVRLDVPEGWEATDDDLPPGVLEARRWRPSSSDLTGLQLVIGCGGTVDDLVDGVVRGGRGVVTVTEAVETAALDVPGLEATRGLVLDLEGTALGGDGHELRAAGLYGHAGTGLVLLELSQPPTDFDPALAEEVFASVEVDGAALSERCQER